MKRNYAFIFFALTFQVFISGFSEAKSRSDMVFYFGGTEKDYIYATSYQSACDQFEERLANTGGWIRNQTLANGEKVYVTLVGYLGGGTANCSVIIKHISTGEPNTSDGEYHASIRCQDGYTEYSIPGKCFPLAIYPEETVPSATDLVCNTVGNPISVSNGIKVSSFDIAPLPKLSVHYNSAGKQWKGPFSFSLGRANEVNYILIKPSGESTLLKPLRGEWSSYRSIDGAAILKEHEDGSGFDYHEIGLSLYFNNSRVGPQLTKMQIFDGTSLIAYDLTHSRIFTDQEDNINVRTLLGELINVNVDRADRLTRVSGKDWNYQLTYSASGMLQDYTYQSSGLNSSRRFLYENEKDSSLLTGIIDERNTRYATWLYNDEGKAVSSEHAGGAEKTTLAYNADGSTTVTNALGKQTVYQFQLIQGAKRITSIRGEPSADCPASNSTFTYSNEGQLVSAIDAQGRVTRYAYNDRGLEISRIEAYGTSEARTVTTEWDPNRLLRTMITRDGQRILYSYDEKGQLVSERVEPVNIDQSR